MTVAIVSAHFPLRPPALHIYAVWALDSNTHQMAPSLVSLLINTLNYLFKLCSHQNKLPKWICRFALNSAITATSGVIQCVQWNMVPALPPCERTKCYSWFPRLFLDVLWLWASVIMPRSWLLDGFSTIRPHYSSLGLSCLSLHPS